MRNKNNSLLRVSALCLGLFLSHFLHARSMPDTLVNKIDPQKFAASVAEKSRKLEDKLVSKSSKVLDKLQKQEVKIYRKLLSTKDSLQAKLALGEIKGKYASLKEKLKNPGILAKAKQYIPQLDSLGTSLKFLDQNGAGGKVKDALGKVSSLQDKFEQAEDIKKFIKERRELLKRQVENLGMVKELKKINKEIYYYAAQVKEYKDILKDPKKIEKKALELLSKTKVFQDFMRKNSMLASLFRLPGGDPNDPGAQASLAGLQTRAQVNGLIQQQIAAGGPNAAQQLQQNLQAAQSQLTELKNKIIKAGGDNSDGEMPDFQPNDQKTKSFLKRLEYGTNFQTQKATSFFPTTSDIGLSVGYKVSGKIVFGFGGTYKLGWGRGWNNIRISHQGVGIRSYADIKLKGSFWISGGYEQHYRSDFSEFDQLRNRSAWQQSGLVGISKVVSMKTKLFKKTKMMLLWDFLSYRQMPVTQPMVFRIGYDF